MSRNYTRPTVDARWADTRNTHIAVATAIHAIADDRRSAEAIWDAPTPAEWDHVTMAVEEYVSQGDFPAEDDGRYPWGEEIVTLTPAMTTYAWRTDAASGEIEAANEEAALAALVSQGEWAEVDSGREARDIQNGAWITIFDAEDVPVLRRGEMP